MRAYIPGLGAIVPGLGFDLMDLLNPIGAIAKSMAPSSPTGRSVSSCPAGMHMETNRVSGGQSCVADAAAAAAAPAMIFCPPGQMPNPQYTMIPEAQRAQAAMAGIQACIPSTTAAATATVKAHFLVGSSKFPATTAGFEDGLAAARRDNRELVLYIKTPKSTRTISMKAAMTAIAAGATVAQAAAAGTIAALPVVPATVGPGGIFTCPTGYTVARDANGAVVCAPPSTATSSVAKVAAAKAAAATRSRNAGRRGTTARASRSRLRGLGDYLDMQQEVARYAAAVTGHPTDARVMLPAGPAIPAWMASRQPPRSLTLQGAFGGGCQNC